MRKSQFKNDIKATKKMRLPWQGLLLWMIACALIIWRFNHFDRLDLARPTVMSIAMLGFLMTLKWRLRQRLWFWIAMTAFVALHVFLILFVRWSGKWVPAAAIAGAATLDFCAMLWILDTVENLRRGEQSEKDERRDRDTASLG
jgi:hypothetical protein